MCRFEQIRLYILSDIPLILVDTSIVIHPFNIFHTAKVMYASVNSTSKCEFIV